jgi:hypothetical protein
MKISLSSGRRWLFALAVQALALAATSGAHAAASGEFCGTLGRYTQTCDPGLQCRVRWHLGRSSIGACTSAACGGLLGLACPDGDFCSFASDAMCGAADQTGLCQPKPQECSQIFQPVCGCDGKTYSNACTANAQGVSVGSTGECPACTSDDECPNGYCDTGIACMDASTDCPPPPPNSCLVCGDGAPLTCKVAEEPCPDDQVREIVNGCYGACVKRHSCEPTGCEYNGKTYDLGASFPSADGCNQCNCGVDGQAVCTLKACICNYTDESRSWVSQNADSCSAITFVCEKGSDAFFDSCGCGCQKRPACRVAGCSSQLCVGPDDDGISTCIFLPEYACYKDGICEAGSDGQCGWRDTPELNDCISQAQTQTTP